MQGTESRPLCLLAGREWASHGDSPAMLKKTLSAAAFAGGLIAASTYGASAAIVCKGHTCWHTHEAYDFPHEAGVVVHEDNWRRGPPRPHWPNTQENRRSVRDGHHRFPGPCLRGQYAEAAMGQRAELAASR